MPNYIFAYHLGEKMPASKMPARPEPEEAAKHRAKWRAWAEGLGDSMVDLGVPLGKSKTVSASGVTDDGGSNPILGFSVVKADSMDAALEMTKACPHLDIGTIEVAQMMEMK